MTPRAEDAVVPGCRVCQRFNALIAADRGTVAHIAHSLSGNPSHGTQQRLMAELDAAKKFLASTRNELANHERDHEAA